MACLFAGVPTSSSPLLNATIEGVVRWPSEFSITRGDFPSMTATQELVVPRSIPMTGPLAFDASLRCVLSVRDSICEVKILKAEKAKEQSLPHDQECVRTVRLLLPAFYLLYFLIIIRLRLIDKSCSAC